TSLILMRRGATLEIAEFYGIQPSLRDGRVLGRSPRLERCFCLAWVAQATRLCRRATRPTEWGAASKDKGRFYRSRTLLPFRPAGRRAGRAGRPHHPRQTDTKVAATNRSRSTTVQNVRCPMLRKRLAYHGRRFCLCVEMAL